MRIAIVAPGTLPVPAVKGGAVESLIDTFIKFAKCSSDVIDVYSASEDIDEIRVCCKENITYNFTPLKISEDTIINRLKSRVRPQIWYDDYLKFVCDNIKNKEYDRVIIENRPTFVHDIRKITNAKIYLHLHNENIVSVKKHCRNLSTECEKIIVVSEYIKKRVKYALGNIDNIEVLYNGIAENQFKKEHDPEKRKNIRERFGINQKDFVVCYTGRFCKEKGVLELVKAFKLLNEEKNIVLLIIGSTWFGNTSSDPYVERVKEEASQCTNKIVFTGYLDNSEVAEIESIADIAVLPSMWNDPLPLVIIEAMASGLPVISTYAGGIPEMCADSCGILLNRTEKLSNEIASRIIQLKEDSQLRQLLGENARKRVEQYFTQKKYYDNFMKLIK